MAALIQSGLDLSDYHQFSIDEFQKVLISCVQANQVKIILKLAVMSDR